jgi:hypothetical protein
MTDGMRPICDIRYLIARSSGIRDELPAKKCEFQPWNYCKGEIYIPFGENDEGGGNHEISEAVRMKTIGVMKWEESQPDRDSFRCSQSRRL